MLELAAPNKLVVDAAGVELVAPNGDVTDEEPPNTELKRNEIIINYNFLNMFNFVQWFPNMLKPADLFLIR